MEEILAPPSDMEFLAWVVKSRKREAGLLIGSVYVIVTVCGTSSLSKIFPEAGHKLVNMLTNAPAMDWLPSFLQFMALMPLPIACALVGPPEWLSSKYKLAVESCKQFRSALTMLVTTWVMFYFILFLRQIHVVDSRWDPWTDLFNNLQGVFLFVAYWILTAKTLSNKGTTEKPSGESWSLWWVYSVLLWLIVVFLVADLVASLRSPNYTVRILFQLLSGLWVGVAMALLTGCLEGQYLGQPRKVTLFLYLYAALQLAYVGFNIPIGNSLSQGDTLSGSVQSTLFLQEFGTVTSLPLKLLFIGYWYWVLQNGLLAFYMKKTRDDIDAVPREWHVFSGVEHKTAAVAGD